MKRRTLLGSIGATVAAPWMSARAAIDDGIAADEILLGQTAVLSGPLGVPISALNAGANLAFAQANAAGGIFGRKVRLLSVDDELKPDRALENYRTLLGQQKVFAFFGCVGSGTTAAAAPLLRDSGAPMVGGYAVADSARRKAIGSAYFVRASTGREAQALVTHLTTLGIQRVVAVQLDNPGGQEAIGLVQQAMAAAKLELLATLPIKGDGSNADEAGAEIARLDPQAVIMYLAGSMPAAVMKAAWAKGARTSFYGMSIVPGEVVAKTLGAELRGLAISQVMTYPWGQADAAVRQYRELAATAGLPVGYVSFEGFVNALVMLEALRRCGAEPTRPRLHAALRGLKHRVAGLEVDFSDREAIAGSRFVELVLVNNEGHFVR